MNIRTATLLLLVCTLFACCIQSHNQTVLHTSLSGHSRVRSGAINSSHLSQSTQFVFGRKYKARVVRVVDGDTIDVKIDGNVYRIRLLGVDCPETTASRNRPYEYDDITDLNYLAKWGAKAKVFAHSMLYNRTVYLV